jgi:hypothetical protein
MRTFRETDDINRAYCWEIDLPVKLVIPATGVCRALTSHSVATVTYGIISILWRIDPLLGNGSINTFQETDYG